MKTTFVLLLTINLFFNVSGQEKTSLGIKGGLNFATLVDDGGILTSYHVGFNLEHNLSEHLLLQPELLYSRQGADIGLFFYDLTQRLDYVNFPILLKYRPFSKPVDVVFGPRIGFLISDEFESDFTDDIENPYVGDYKSVDFGLDFGIEAKLNKNLGVGARYGLGLTDVLDNGEETFKTAYFQLFLLYQFLKF